MYDFFGPLVPYLVAVTILAPLGIWKLIEIIAWVSTHIHFGG